MTNIRQEFSRRFGDFETLFHDTDLQSYNIYTWADQPGTAQPVILRIIGTTWLPDDYLLHTVHVPQSDLGAETEDLVNTYGLCFITLSQLINLWGFTIKPIPYEDDDEDDDEEKE